MKILEKIELRLSSWIEGVFRRRIPHHIEPVDIGRALLQALDRNRQVSLACVYAPNSFVVYLSADDLAHLKSLTRTLEGELKGVLQEKAEKDQLCFIGPLTVVFQADSELTRGKLRVEAAFEEGEIGGAEPEDVVTADTQVYRRSPSSIGFLVVNQGRAFGGGVPLRDGLTIGRNMGCDLVLDEPNVSRIHARVVCRGGQWFIEDNNSTNGLLVNGERVDSALLRFGDEIKIGTARLVYRESL